MHVDFTKSGMNKWSLSVLYVLMTAFMFWYSIKAYNAPNNIDLQLGEFLAYDSGDTEGYIAPMESYITTGEYKIGSDNPTSIGRGPYYAVYYFIFRQFLPVAKAYDGVAIMQILWYVLSIILLMKIVEPYIKYKSFVWLIPIVLCSLQVSFTYLQRILTDPIANSQLICFAFFYVRYNRKGEKWCLWLASLFLSMASVMKPYLLPIYAICFFDWVISNKVLNIKNWARYVAIMSVPLVVICLPFTIRNAVKLHTFAPVQNTMWGGYTQDSVNAAMRDMVRVWGENHLEWEGLGMFFMPCEGMKYDKEIPGHIYTKEYDRDDIYDLAEQTRAYKKMSNGAERDSLGTILFEKMTRYRNAYVLEHPLWRIRATWKQFGFMAPRPNLSFVPNHRHSGIRHIVSNTISFLSYLCSWLLFIGGIIGSLLVLMRYEDLRFYVLIILYIALFFSITLCGEGRYYIIATLYKTIGMVIFVDWCVSGLAKKFANGTNININE